MVDSIFSHSPASVPFALLDSGLEEPAELNTNDTNNILNKGTDKMAKTCGGCQSGAVTVRRSSRLATKGRQIPAGLSRSPSPVLSAANCSLSTAIHSCGSPKQSTSPSSNSPTASASPTRVSSPCSLPPKPALPRPPFLLPLPPPKPTLPSLVPRLHPLRCILAQEGAWYIISRERRLISK